MLTMPKVLRYVKRKLGYPHVAIEKSDDDIQMDIEMFVLNEFSKYVPEQAELRVDLTNIDNQVVGSDNIFYIFDPDGLDIISVEDVIPSADLYYLNGYPFTAPFTGIDATVSTVIAMENAENAEQFSNTYFTFEFMPPNKVRIYCGMIPEVVMVKYERVHGPSLMSIPAEYENEFLCLCLADTMEDMGSVRNKYQTITTPFGDIPLNADLGASARDLKERVITVLKELPSNTLIEIG